ncbi:hypothetical protein CHS0354_006680 [Potamilus streckersoni]|uniref:MAM domain-containing protein n=1 Tax=Potamilus streckersoni TaxID=2493646 RepID=A0AAE0SYP2_9BIVA|nr:hypothetical protein CHS0354_006680 [Potamilus streckersoni]
MRGSGIGNLSIYIEKNSTTGPSSTITKSSNRTILWSQEGELDDKWYAVEITIQTEEAFRVLLEGTTIGKTGNKAVDDIKLSKYSCKEHCTRSTSATRDFNKCCVNFKCNETEQNIATLVKNCSTNSQINTSGSPTTCCVNFNGNETEKITVTLFENGVANSQTTTSGSETTRNENDSIATENIAICAFAVNNIPSLMSFLCLKIDTWTTSSKSDLEHSTTNNIRLAERKVTNSQTTVTRRQTTTLKENATVTDGVIIGSVLGAVVLLAVSLSVGIWKCRERRRHSKKAESIELRPISSKVSIIEDRMGDNSSAAHFVNPVYTESSNTARTGNTAFINVKTDNENYEYASTFTPTTPVNWTEDAYDTCEEKKHHVDGAYDHIPTHFIEEYETTQLSMHTRQDANETYDHVTIFPDVYDETNVMAQTTAIQYKSYDHVTNGTCETPVSKQNISSSQDDIYELIA